MNWKFWRRPNDDYGKITNVSVAWEFAHEEAADRIQAQFEEEKVERERRFKEEFEDLEDWLSHASDKPASTATRTPYSMWGKEYDDPWGSDSNIQPCTAVSLVYDSKGLNASSIKGNFPIYYAPCILPVGHPPGEHKLSDDKPWIDEKPSVPPILVHELVGEINGPEGLVQLKEALLRQAKDAKKLAKRRYKKVEELGQRFYSKE